MRSLVVFFSASGIAKEAADFITQKLYKDENQ